MSYRRRSSSPLTKLLIFSVMTISLCALTIYAYQALEKFDEERMAKYAGKEVTAEEREAAKKAHATVLNLVAIFGVCVLGIMAYFLPTIVAFYRDHNDALAIFFLNFFCFFLPVLGWVFALVWACLSNTERRYRGPSSSSAATTEVVVNVSVPSPPAVETVTPIGVPYTCPHCLTPVQVPLALIGTPVSCNRCLRAFVAQLPPSPTRGRVPPLPVVVELPHLGR